MAEVYITKHIQCILTRKWGILAGMVSVTTFPGMFENTNIDKLIPVSWKIEYDLIRWLNETSWLDSKSATCTRGSDEMCFGFLPFWYDSKLFAKSCNSAMRYIFVPQRRRMSADLLWNGAATNSSSHYDSCSGDLTNNFQSPAVRH